MPIASQPLVLTAPLSRIPPSPSSPLPLGGCNVGSFSFSCDGSGSEAASDYSASVSVAAQECAAFGLDALLDGRRPARSNSAPPSGPRGAELPCAEARGSDDEFEFVEHDEARRGARESASSSSLSCGSPCLSSPWRQATESARLREAGEALIERAESLGGRCAAAVAAAAGRLEGDQARDPGVEGEDALADSRLDSWLEELASTNAREDESDDDDEWSLFDSEISSDGESDVTWLPATWLPDGAADRLGSAATSMLAAAAGGALRLARSVSRSRRRSMVALSDDEREKQHQHHGVLGALFVPAALLGLAMAKLKGATASSGCHTMLSAEALAGLHAIAL